MTDYDSDVQLCACLPYIPCTSLQERILAPASLKDDDSRLVIEEQIEK